MLKSSELSWTLPIDRRPKWSTADSIGCEVMEDKKGVRKVQCTAVCSQFREGT